ncbi:MAG: hypothetical protein ACXWUE_33540 [Polyangiales bacterium]
MLAAAVTFASALSFEKSAHADEPLKPTEPSLMEEPGEVVDVVDAFDTKNNDPFDLHLSLGFHQSWERGKVRRESYVGPDGQTSTNSGFTSNVENVASFKHTTSTLNMRADVGLYKDLGLFIRLPLILADDRSLDDLDGSSKGVNAQFGRASDSATGDPLFKLPFTSPTRSGIDYIAVGLRWGLFNQYRDPSKPNWTWEVEGRFGVGEPLHACNANPENIPDAAAKAAGVPPGGKYPQCPGLTSDPTNQPVYDTANTPNRYYRNPKLEGRSPGISRGTNAIKVGTLFSNRYRYVEPYGGFWFMAEWQKANTDMGNYGDLQGIITNRPPLQGGLTGGLMIHPWENRELYQRFTIDLRFDARYISQGRDYTPLFDALGSSSASSLVAPNPAQYQAGTGPDGKPASVGNYRKPIAFTGVTDVEAHGAFGGKAAFVVQAAKYIRFNLGVGLTYEQAYTASTADACNPDFTPSDSEAGRCKGASGPTGTPNPNHRPVIDLPGRRFRITETFLWDAWVSGTVMF